VLAGAVIGSLITEFTGVAGVGELFGLSRSFTLPLAAATLLFIVAIGSYKRVERAALIVGLFELAFFAVAWAAHPGLAALARDAIDLPIRNRPFDAGWFYGVYAACVLGSGAAVWFASNLVWLNIVAQVFNAFLMPLVIGLLVALAVTALPESYRLRGWYLATIIAVCTIVSAVGIFGGIRGLM
jgi:hypothetical protein